MSNHYGLKLLDHQEKCPYLPDRRAVLSFYLPDYRRQPEDFDVALSEGVRRSGGYIYHTNCPKCQACQPIRIPVDLFRPRRRHRRVLAKAGEVLRVAIGDPVVDQTRVDLYNKHKLERGLGEPGSELDHNSLAEFLGVSCCHTKEFRFFAEDRLVGVSVVDLGVRAMSAVYCYYDPDLAHLGIGNFAVLTQIETCRQWGLPYLYLGFYVAENAHMRYKAQFLPHQRYVAGRWKLFE